jgi:transposase
VLRCKDKQLWRRIEFYVAQARALETSPACARWASTRPACGAGSTTSPWCTTWIAKRLLFATEGRDHQTVVDFAEDLKAHGGDPAQVRHVCMDMSAAYAKGVALALPEAQISYDRFHVVSMAIEAMDQVRRAEMATDAQAVRARWALARKTLKQLMWGMRRNPSSWSAKPARRRCTGCSARRSRARGRGG